MIPRKKVGWSPILIGRNFLRIHFEKHQAFFCSKVIHGCLKNIFNFISNIQNNYLQKHSRILLESLRKSTNSKTLLANQIGRDSLRNNFENSKNFSQQGNL